MRSFEASNYSGDCTPFSTTVEETFLFRKNKDKNRQRRHSLIKHTHQQLPTMNIPFTHGLSCSYLTPSIRRFLKDTFWVTLYLHKILAFLLQRATSFIHPQFKTNMILQPIFMYYTGLGLV